MKQNKIATIRITDLHLRTIIGVYNWEQIEKQDIIINISMQYNASKAAASDDIKHAIDYKSLTKSIIRKVEKGRFLLLEKLADVIMAIVLSDKRVLGASVRVDKPGALRFAKSVSLEFQALP